MVVPSVGEVIVLSFPFSDLTGSKQRPALVLADAGHGDWVLCQITSNPYADPLAVALAESSFAEGGLKLRSYARPGKLFTANSAIFVRSAGRLGTAAYEKVVDAVVALLRPKQRPV